MKSLPLPNSVLPAKLYVILDGSGKVVDEVTASNSWQALQTASDRAKDPTKCRTAILKPKS